MARNSLSEDTTLQHALADGVRMRALLEAAVDGIISIDQRGLIETINPAAERLFGYSAAELLGKNISILMPAPYRAEHDHYIANYLATGKKRIIGIGREVLGLRKDGSTFPMDLSVAETRLNGEPIFLGVVRDITDRKRAEEALRASHETLEKALADVKAMTQQLWQAAKLASVGELAAGIAHELNNPLATVSLRVESVLARTPAEDPRRRALEVIQQETKRMGDLVANLLQFSRRSRDESSTVDLHQEIGKAVELIHHQLRKRQITVVQDLPSDTPTIYADRQKLRQVFLNLLTNASDAMPQGGALTLRTAAIRLGDDTPGVRIEVIDTGVGIPAEHLDKVLDPFFTTKEEDRGTGLGLAICRRIVQEHQGTIKILSAVDKGTTIRIELPVQNLTNVKTLLGQEPAK